MLGHPLQPQKKMNLFQESFVYTVSREERSDLD